MAEWPGRRGEPGARSDGRTLPPRGRGLPWRYFSSFASAVTVPMVTQAPRGAAVSPHLGAESWPQGLEQGEGQQGGDGEQVAGPVLTPRPAGFQPGVELWGPLQAGGLGNGRTGLGGARLLSGSVGEFVAQLERLGATSWRGCQGEKVTRLHRQAWPSRGWRGVGRGRSERAGWSRWQRLGPGGCQPRLEGEVGSLFVSGERRGG